MASTRTSKTAGENSTTDAVGGETQPEDQSVAAAEATTNDQSPEDSTESGLRVKYTGPSVHTRILTGQDFSRAAGIDGVPKAVWSTDNDHIVSFKDHQEELREWFTNSPAVKDQFKVLEPGQS